MAENKKSFILYADIIDTVEKIPDAKAGKLLKTILAYVNDRNPNLDELDILVQVAFEPIKQQLKRDLKKWDKTRSLFSEAGKRGGIKSGESRRNKAKRSLASKNEANEAVNVNANVNVNVNDNVTKRERFTAPTRDEVVQAMMEKLDDFTAMGEADKFISFYESKGWLVGKSKMKNWRAAVSGWVSRMGDYGKKPVRQIEDWLKLAEEQDKLLENGKSGI
jgi:hypothetical protein